MEYGGQVQALLGSGAHSHVFRGQYGQNAVAFKRIQKLHTPQQEGPIDEDEALKRLDHPNVMKLLHVENQNEFRYV